MSLSERLKFRRRFSQPGSAIGPTVVFLFLSFLIHCLTLVSISGLFSTRPKAITSRKPKQSRITINYTKKDPQSQPDGKRIAEADQAETREPAPTNAHLGKVNHRTSHETRTRPQNVRQAQKAARRKSSLSQAMSGFKDTSIKRNLATAYEGLRANAKDPSLTVPHGRVFLPERQLFKNKYEEFLKNSLSGFPAQDEERGSQSAFIDEGVAIGEAIDLNTKEYRYIGYFTNLRKSIELTWSYPDYAMRRGLYGNVHLKFTIDKSGKVSRIMVLDSSGHRILDTAIVDAIQLAAPFAPLPKSFGRKLIVQGNFRYVLN